MMRVITWGVIAASVLSGLLSAVSDRAEAASGPAIQIVDQIDDRETMALPGNTRPEAVASNDRGRVADDRRLDHMLLQLRAAPQQQAALDTFLTDVQDRNSPEYHRWLTAEEFGARFGAALEDRRRIASWLTAHGFTVNQLYANGLLIDFSGTAGEVRSAFGTEIHALEVDGVPHFANMSDPKIPAALAPVVTGIVALHDFRPRSERKSRVNYTDSNGSLFVTPADLATIYDINPLRQAGITGKGEIIDVIENTDVYSTANWKTFRSRFGLSGYGSGSLVQVHPAGAADNCPDPGVDSSSEGEAALDIDWATAAAPAAKIELVSCSYDFGDALLIALQNRIAEKSLPDVVSISYGECETENGAASNAAYNKAFQQAVSEGVSIFVSSGDQNASVCDGDASASTSGITVNALASSPFAVAVGGTDFGSSYDGTTATYWSATNTKTGGSAKSYIPEIPWNGSCGSKLLASYYSATGSAITYGASGFCNTSEGSSFLGLDGGSGGPSRCATGSSGGSAVVGGTCKGYAKPAYQSGLFGNPADGVRDLPDVSLFASNGIWNTSYVYCDTDPSDGASCSGDLTNWAAAGGTSFAAPIMAAIQALVDEKNNGRQGNPNPVYYALAKKEYGSKGNSACNSTLGKSIAASCIFHDIARGDIDANCTGTHNCYLPSGKNGVLSTVDASYKIAYAAAVGWDFATGIGSINATNLVNGWSAGEAALSASMKSNSAAVAER